MAKISTVDFNKIPRQRFSTVDIQKVSSIIQNIKSGNMEQATAEFDSFARDKKMDKVRSIGLRLLTAGTLILGAIVAPHVCPKWIKTVGNSLASRGAEFARNHKKVYNSIAKKFPELKGNVGEDFVTRLLENSDALKKLTNKLALNNTKSGQEIFEGLAKRNVKNVGDIVGIGAVALGSIPVGSAVSGVGNLLDEVGDGDRQLKLDQAV